MMAACSPVGDQVNWRGRAGGDRRMAYSTSHPPRRRRRRTSRGFTLVELLVVIGIIAVLIAVLMPGLSGARRQARSVACLSNLRQLAAAYQMYCNENKGKCFRYADGLVDPTGESFWVPLLGHYAGNIDEIRICPEATEVGSTPYGNAFTAWGDPDGSGNVEWLKRGGSYGMNMWLHPVPANSPVDGLLVFTSGGTRVISPRSAFIGPAAKESSRVPLIADCLWLGGWPRHTDSPPTRLSGEYEPTGNDMRRFCMARHKRNVNVVFLDGHASTVPLPDLWKLKWHNEFEPTDVVLPRE